MELGKWLCCYGDYEIMLAQMVTVRRYQREIPMDPLWKVDSPWHHVKFFWEFTATKDTVLNIDCEGRIGVFFEGVNRYVEDFNGSVPLKKGVHRIVLWVYNPSGLPCVRLRGENIVSENPVLCGPDRYVLSPAEKIDCGSFTPNTFRLPRRKKEYVEVLDTHKGKVYDFGKIIFGFVRLENCENLPHCCYYGETLSEALSDEYCEQISRFMPKNGKYCDKIGKAFRYLRVVGSENYRLKVEEEYTPKKYLLRVDMQDETLEKIVKTALDTYAACDREFLLDGIKRDRWVWSGDVYQALKDEYFVSYDLATARRNILTLLGKTPVISYINQIMDYTLYAVMAAGEYFDHSGDTEFIANIYDILKEHVDYALGRTDGDGFLYGRDNDWVFVDWNSELDTAGELCFEQILFFLALKNFVRIGNALQKDVSNYALAARKLKRKINEVFWDDTRGVYIHSRKGGKKSDAVTAYANMFAVLYGFADTKKCAKIKRALLGDKSIPAVNTPYMQAYKLSCLFELGETETACKEIYEYWGGMVAEGATTFWEYYEKGDKNEPPRPMYGRPFAMSRCHIWSAGVLYLVPRYFYGIRNDIEFGEKFVAKPNCALVKNSGITVAMKRGKLNIKVKEDEIEVYSTEIGGTLIAFGREFSVPAGRKIICKRKS